MKKLCARLIRAMIVVFSQLPLKVHYFFGDVFSWLLKNVVCYRTGVVWMNISRAFPEMRYGQLKEVYDAFYRHLGEIVAETVWFGGSSYRRLVREGIVAVRNPEVISEAFLSSPSVTVLCSHCGNWEILGGFYGFVTADGFKPSFDETDLTVVYKELSSKVADMVFAENRTAVLEKGSPDAVIESKRILRFSIENRHKKRIYGYPVDQGPYKGIFLNQRTYAMTGSVGVACKLSHAVLYLKMKNVSRGRYEWEFIPICADASLMKPDEIMNIYYRILEEEIKETPHNWLWSHNRWKIR